MSHTGLDTFDRTIQTANIWLKAIMQETGPDRAHAYHILLAVLTALRDRLTIEQSAHLAAQLPLLIRGMFFHGWQPAHQPSRDRKAEDFLAHVQAQLEQIRPTDSKDSVAAVFRVLEHHISPGEVAKIKQALPQDIRKLWPDGV